MTLHNLPSQPTPFIGRAEELAEIDRLLNDPACRLLTLVGPGGIGKTRLAVEAARGFTLPDGVYFVPLQPLTSPDFIVSAIADALDFQFYGGRDPKQQLLDYLRDKSLLLALDNFEHLLEGASIVSDIRADAPGVKALVTSRERLQLQEEWVLEVSGLPFPPNGGETEIERYSAVQLFVENARRVQVGFRLIDAHKPAIIRICRLVGGMPLATELAAAWVRALSCEQIATELERSLDILETPARNVPPRHRTMRAVFEPTWARLSEDERAVFMKLSVFRGGFTRAAAEYVAGASLRTLSGLVDKSLLRVDVNSRYDMHELLRQYAEEQLQAAGEMEAARTAHSGYCAAFLHQQWQPMRTHEQVIALDEIEAEFENVRTAWQTMVAQRNTAQLSMAVYPLWYFSDIRNRYRDALALFKQAEDALRPAAGSEDADRVIGQMLARRGFLYVSLGKPGEGQALAEEGLAILQRVGSPEDVCLAWQSLNLTRFFLGDHMAEKLAAEQAAQIARRNEDHWLLAWALSFLTFAAIYINDFDEARRSGQECFDLAESCGDAYLRGFSGGGLGYLAVGLGNYVEAKRWFEQCLKLFEAVGQAGMIADAHRELGHTHFCLHDYRQAAYHYQQSLKVLTDHSTHTFQAIEILFYVAELWAAHGDKEGAIELLTLLLQHPESLPVNRDQAAPRLLQLQAEVTPPAFAAAQERGKTLELQTVIAQLIVELSQFAQTDALPLSAPINQPLADALTERELEILHLVAQGLSNRDIARELVLSLGTVKTHIHNICGKLDATSRTQAIARARDLNLI